MRLCFFQTIFRVSQSGKQCMRPATCDFCVQPVPASPAKMLVGEPPQTPDFGPSGPEVNAPIRGRLRVLRTLVPGAARKGSTGREPRQEQAALRRCFALLTRPPARAGGQSRGKPYTGFPSGKATLQRGHFSRHLMTEARPVRIFRTASHNSSVWRLTVSKSCAPM
jgi:hypothetical protein